MKFESKAHMAQELLAGKRFEATASEIVEDAILFYDETKEPPFRYTFNGSEYDIGHIWSYFDQDIWTEVKPRHVHQDLIDIYKEGQTWQFKPIGRTLWENCRYRSGIWHKPDWREDAEYRLHPHNDLIQVTKAGDSIQCLSANTWVDVQEPAWSEDCKYRIKPATKILHEWYVKTHDKVWYINEVLMTEEEIASKEWAIEYKKTGRSLEVEV